MSSNTLLWPSQGTKPEERLDKYKYLRLPSQGVGGGVPVAAFDSMAYEDLDIMGYEPEDWFNALWQQRIELTINAGQVPSTQFNFPLLINDIYPDLIGEVEAELRFTGDDNIQLEYEIQEFDNSTGLLIAWINKPSVSDGDTVRIYFDNPAAVDEQNPNAVFDSDYTSVYHLNSVGIDSTANAQDLFISNTTTVAAKIGTGLEFAGNVNSFAIRNPYTIFPLDEITCEFWIKTDGSGDGIISYAVGMAALANHFLLFRQETLAIFIANLSQPTGESFADNLLHHIVVTWKSSNGDLILYIDGIVEFFAAFQQGETFTNNGALVLGQEQDEVGAGFQAAQAFDGTLDEVRLSNIVRDADYVSTSFNNQNDPSAFYSTANVEARPSVPMGYEN